MKLPEYVSPMEVRRVCKELGLSDWHSTKAKKPEVTSREAKAVLGALDTRGMDIELEEFRRGLVVELEHGTMYAEANVTNNHPVLTGKIVLAHLKETLDYYKRLEVMELEGDLFNSLAAGRAKKAANYYGRLARARLDLGRHEAQKLKGA